MVARDDVTRVVTPSTALHLRATHVLTNLAVTCLPQFSSDRLSFFPLRSCVCWIRSLQKRQEELWRDDKEVQ